MLFRRFVTEGLAHYSYALGCTEEGSLAVVDPRRDVDEYLGFADREGLEITHVLETHIHADYASGARELADRTGAMLALSAYDDGETYEVAFPHEELVEGDALHVGTVRLEPLHTPGHTPEHVSFLVYDEAGDPHVPELLLSGDFLFVGSLGRPDLLGEEAKRDLASALYDSVHDKLPSLPGTVEVFPAHGSGSFCGAGMSGRPSSTLEAERRTNPYLSEELGREEFVQMILDASPFFPRYYVRMKNLNSEGPEPVGGRLEPPLLEPDAFFQLVEEGALVVDVRPPERFGEGHLAGSIGIGNGPDLSVWSSWIVPYDRPLLLVAEGGEEATEAVRRLVRVGLDDVLGYLSGGMRALEASGAPVVELEQLTPAELHRRLERGESLTVLDVRTDAEWRSGHVPEAVHVMGGEVPEQLDRLTGNDEPVAVICGTGYRSTVIASLLAREGKEEVQNVRGGMAAWAGNGLPVERGGA